MRPKERINIFFKYCNTAKKFEKYLKWLDIDPLFFTKDEMVKVSKNVIDNKTLIKRVWKDKKNQDLRLTQFLVNNDFLDNYYGFWYHKEEELFLIEVLQIPCEKVLLWGQNFDKDMRRLKKTIFKPIEEMNTDHIKAILGHLERKEMRLSPQYIDTFEKVLKERV